MKPLIAAVLFSICAPALAYDPLAVPGAGAAVETVELSVTDKARRDREIPLLAYLPPRPGPVPVVLFSHGLGGTRHGSSYLGRHWAARGYVAIFLQHPGSDDGVWKETPPARRALAMKAAANLTNFTARALDVRAVLDALQRWQAEAGHPLASRVDLSRIGMSGHSFGAVTTQAVSGQALAFGAQPFTDARIQAAVIMSPTTPALGDPARAFANVRIPWLLMTGTEDIARIGSVTLGASDLAARLGVYPALPPGGKYELVLDGAGHFVFTDGKDTIEDKPRDPNHHRVILALSTAFWDAYLRNDGEARAWLDGDKPRSLMAAQDKWQRK